MASWLFRRRSRRKRSLGAGQPQPGAVARSQTVPEPIVGTFKAPSTQQSLKKQRADPNRLQRRARTHSFESGRRDSLHVSGRQRRHRDPAPPLPRATGAIPVAASAFHANLPPVESQYEGVHLDDDDDDDNFQRVPTLHANKRNGQHLKPRRSSKRRKNSHDREREAELKAMSSFVPIRPATDDWTAGRPLKKESRRVRTGPFGLGLTGSGKGLADKEQRSSDVSLPIADSIHSSMSSESEQISYKISPFDALAPKPTLRFASQPKWGPSSGSSMPQKAPTQRRRFSEKEPIPEATLKAHKRIDDLADDFSAGDLRELMERDNRRRERKRQKEQEKLERRLARRAEKQKVTAESGGQNLERGVIGREIGLGIDPSSAVVTSSRRRPSGEMPSSPAQQPDEALDNAPENSPRRHTPSPLGAFHRTGSMPLEVTSPVEVAEVPPPIPVQNPRRRTLLKSKKTRSKSPTPIAELAETPQKGREGSPTRGSLSWKGIFRWGNKGKRNSGPSSFSNTSRDSMGAQTQLPASAPLVPATVPAPPRLSMGAPRRTLSRFREDLPDFLSTPPDSRAQTPERDEMSAIPEHSSSPIAAANDPARHDPEQGYRTPPTGSRSFEDVEDMRHTPTSWVAHERLKPSPEPQQSMSMASIGSEGSWLSSRLVTRSRSSQLHHQAQSPSHSRQSRHRQHASGVSIESSELHEYETTEDDMADVAEDEYLHEYAHRSGGGANNRNRVSTGEARPSSDYGDSARIRAVGGGQAMFMREDGVDHMKSVEGLMHAGDDDSEMLDIDSPISPVSVDTKEEEADLQRATSINLGQRHARHISAGSAKLLELSPRSSVDAKGRGLQPRSAT